MIPATLSECMRPASVFAVNLAGDSMFRITPVVGDVPILGELFKSKRFQRNETELVILITPYLVSPTSERNENAAGQPIRGHHVPAQQDQARRQQRIRLLCGMIVRQGMVRRRSGWC